MTGTHHGLPFPLRTRVRQARGGATVNDPTAPDGIRECSPYGVVVAYRDGRMGVLHDEAMWRPPDRYSECHLKDARVLYRYAGEAGDLTGGEIDLLAEHLGLAHLDALAAAAADHETGTR